MMVLQHIKRFRLPFAKTFGPGQYREGIVIGAKTDDGKHLVAEASPLPPFSRESVHEAETQLRMMMEGKAIGYEEMFPSVACALETLQWQTNPSSLPNNVVSTYALAQSPEDAAQHATQGFQEIKAKIHHGTVSEILDELEHYRASVGEQVKLRVDANQSWGFDTALEVLRRAGPLGVSLVEEPLKDPTKEHLLKLQRQSTVDIYADESIRTIHDLEMLHEAFDGLVIKPMFSSGFSTSMKLATQAHQLGMPVTITTALDGAVGRRLALELAARVPTEKPRSHGLMTGHLFTEDIGPALHFEANKIRMKQQLSWPELSEEVWQQCF